ncbi:MAG: cell envelope integrity protein TolA [Pseudomonadota bacterium]
MSAAIYAEPYKLPAGILAVAVHIAFFALLYFGISWHTLPPPGLVVDIWQSLPEPNIAPPPPAPPVKVEPIPEPIKPVESPQAAEPPPPVKVDIDLAKKKKPEIKPPEPKKKPVELLKPEPKKPVEVSKPIEPEKPFVVRRVAPPPVSVAPPPTLPPAVDPGVLAAQRAQAEQARVLAEQGAAQNKIVNDYKARIRSKIRANIVEPPDVQGNPKAIFDVTLLPDGSVMNVKQIKPSGSEAYDSAVERAILKAHVLPLPPDPSLFSNFRELRLTFCLKEEGIC